MVVWERVQSCSNSSVHRLDFRSGFLDASPIVAAKADMQWALNVFSPRSAAVKISLSGIEARHIAVDIISTAQASRDVLTSTWCCRRFLACLLVS